MASKPGIDLRAWPLEMRRSLAAHGIEPLARIAQAKPQELERQGGIEARSCEAQPVIERVFGEPHRARAARRQFPAHLQRARHDRLIVDAERHEANALRLGP